MHNTELTKPTENPFSPSLIQSPNGHLAKWLAMRGIDSQNFQEIFSWDLKSLPNFWNLKDLPKAVERIKLAIDRNEKIGIFGDYDVDGTTSCALFYRFFQKINYPVFLYQPSRFIEGYGLHRSSIDQAVSDGINVLITVDCGTSSLEAADAAVEAGIDLIITDHHKDAAPKMPNCFALINPNRRDEVSSPLQALAGVGVAFAVCVCLRESLIKQGRTIDSLYDLLSYVAIGTISDLATLNSTNLILCRHGMKNLFTTSDVGLKKFLEQKEFSLDYLDSEIISFLIGPMINSKGRIDHPDIALKLLTTNDRDEAYKYHETLLNSNGHRKKIQNQVFEEAKKIAENEIAQNPIIPALILYQPHWHEGVIGIVASKLVEEFKRPAMIFTNSEQKDCIKASVRTFNTLDIFQCLKTQEHFFLKFGGHKAAAGLTLELKLFSQFKQSFLTYLENINALEIKKDDTPLLLPINFNQIDGSLLQEIYRLAPFGQGNPMPKWQIHGAKITKHEILKGLHVKWHLESYQSSTGYFDRKLTGISFNFINKNNVDIFEQLKSPKAQVIIDAWIKVNIFRQKSFLQLHIDQLNINLDPH